MGETFSGAEAIPWRLPKRIFFIHGTVRIFILPLRYAQPFPLAIIFIGFSYSHFNGDSINIAPVVFQP